jgi:hypothetical protein
MRKVRSTLITSVPTPKVMVNVQARLKISFPGRCRTELEVNKSGGLKFCALLLSIIFAARDNTAQESKSVPCVIFRNAYIRLPKFSVNRTTRAAIIDFFCFQR